MKFGHIVTVGTSLITNEGGKNVDSNRGKTLKDLEDASQYLSQNTDGASVKRQRDQAKKALLKLDCGQEFGFRPQGLNMPKDRMPQELSYLWKFANGGYDRSQCSRKDMVRLLSSDTNEAKNCALIICDVLQNSPWNQWFTATFNVIEDFASGVNAEKGEEFRSSGLHNWMEKIQEMVKVLREGCDRIFLNVTGGYKGTVPYSTLMGMLHNDKVEIAYLFEDSSEIIFIPAYPVGLNFHQWHENALRLRMAQQPGGTDYFILDPPVESLLQSDQTLSAFGKALEEQYKCQLNTDSLKVYSKNIITRLLNEKGPGAGSIKPGGAPDTDIQWWKDASNEIQALQGILRELIDKVGDIIWLGDKIPEMVEHAQRHHHNLLEFTELLLSPILYYKPCFLNHRERFVLLSAVLLHDSGHSLDRISVQVCKNLAALFGGVNVEGLGEEILLFPSDIRDYHQYLTGIRLNDEGMAADLGWKGHKGLKEKGLPACLHDAVILACLYHRRRMDYDVDTVGEEGKFHLTGQYPGPLCKRVDPFKQNCGVDLMKVVALLRLIDGCDSQARRAGPRARIDLTLSLLEQDYRTAAMRAEQAYKAFQNGPNCGTKEDWMQDLVEEKHDDANGLVTKPWSLHDSKRDRRIKALRMLLDGTTNQEQKQCARLWLLAAEAANRAQMRFGQFDHFMKHRAVTEIRVLPAKDFGVDNFAFDIILVPDSSDKRIWDPRDPSRYGTVKDFWLKQCLFKGDSNQYIPLAETIEKEVCSEYDQVAKYAAEKLKLKAIYWWEDDWNQRSNGGQPFYPRSDGVSRER